ncbi:MAG: response regulator [Candidatus Omnitrophica bacterium]|nr:response regulator [Candidatus Omnitrophota bacterium]MBU0881382.1 response regulator [Candidatus Omnitrophota bacterium]MBU1038312.1 response regulator [Candidatus Omnitrophota bacterium]MBU1807924.1 response regulator [Candidatus Omnitrophota bacterium]
MKKILLIDDEKDFIYFIKKDLELSGAYIVLAATNGKDGLYIAARQKPDLIILDVVMPSMGGFEVLKVLKENKSTTMIPVIMLTAIDTEEAREKALGLYNEEYIVKPVSIAELRAKIDGVLGRRR